MGLTFNTLRLGACVVLLSARHRHSARRVARPVQLPLAPLWDLLLLVPFMIPPYIAALGWIMLLQPHGYVRTTVRRACGAAFCFRSGGVVFVMTLNVFPVVYFAVSRSMAASGSRLADVGRVCGGSPWRCFMRITLPLAAPGIAASLLLVFAMAIEEYGTPAALGRQRRLLRAGDRHRAPLFRVAGRLAGRCHAVVDPGGMAVRGVPGCSGESWRGHVYETMNGKPTDAGSANSAPGAGRSPRCLRWPRWSPPARRCSAIIVTSFMPHAVGRTAADNISLAQFLRHPRQRQRCVARARHQHGAGRRDGAADRRAWRAGGLLRGQDPDARPRGAGCLSVLPKRCPASWSASG